MTTSADSPQHPPAARRARLEQRLRLDLHFAQGRYAQIANLEELGDLRARIQSTASELSPDAPGAAIRVAQRDLKLDDLVIRLHRRSQLPADVTSAAEGVRVQARWQETRILSLARELEPADPRRAIDLAHQRALDQIARLQPPGAALEGSRRRLHEASRLMKRFAALPQPTQDMRVYRILRDLRRRDVLDLQHRDASEARCHLVFSGNVIEIRAALERVPEAWDLLGEVVGDIYRQPDVALQVMSKSARSIGLEETIERFEKRPADFGKLHGIHVPGIGDSPRRRRALELVWHASGHASTAHARKDRLENGLTTALSYRQLQNDNRELLASYPGREKLLAELGRQMEGLELHQVRSLLQPGQAKLVQDVRRAEQHYLLPLREGAGAFRSVEEAGVRLARPAVQAKAQELATLFRSAPGHILRRLTPPQMQGVLLAASVAKRVVKAVGKSAAV